MPFRLQDVVGQSLDRSNKQVKVLNIPEDFQSAQVKALFGKCCHGRFEKVYVPSDCGPRCTRNRCSGRWIDCEDPVSRGFAYITFMEHKHAQSAIDMNGRGVDSLILSVTWAKNVNTIESAIEKSQKWAQACEEKDAEFARKKAIVCSSQSQIVVSQSTECPLDFQFEGKIKARPDAHRGNKLTRGFIEVNPKQLPVLKSHPLWQDGFKTDVFWHRKQCSNHETRFPGDVVTFTVTVGSTSEGMQAQHVQLK
jgi:RNA recognition motif-containing protein